MGLFDRSASKLSGKTALLLDADPGDALLHAARLYDPGVRRWHSRLVFRNGVLLLGPVTVTPELEQQAGLPPGMAVAYYTEAALQSNRERRSHEAKQSDGTGWFTDWRIGSAGPSSTPGSRRTWRLSPPCTASRIWPLTR